MLCLQQHKNEYLTIKKLVQESWAGWIYMHQYWVPGGGENLQKAKNSTSWLALFFLSWNNFSDLQWLDSVKDIWLLRSSQDSYDDLQI